MIEKISRDVFKNTVIENDIFNYELWQNPNPKIYYDFPERTIRWNGSTNAYFKDNRDFITYFLHEFCHCYDFFMRKKLRRLVLPEYGYSLKHDISFLDFRFESNVLALQKYLIQHYSEKQEHRNVPSHGLDGLWNRVIDKPNINDYTEHFNQKFLEYEKIGIRTIGNNFRKLFSYLENPYII